MAKIVTKLNLNKTPQQVENNSLIFAKNIKLLKDASLSADSSFDKIFDSYRRDLDELHLRDGYVGHIVGVNNTVYFFLNLEHDGDNANVKIYKYNEADAWLNTDNVIHCGWHYSGGKITGCTTINNTGEEILTICEYFEDDDEENPKVPIKHINTTRCINEVDDNYPIDDERHWIHYNENETIYTQHPDLPISNLFLTGRYTCNIPNGVYQFFIRYKIRKDFYTPWIPCSKECFAGTPEITNTIQGQIKNINIHKDAAESFIFRLHHCFSEYTGIYKQYQLGFILSHEDAAVARSWKHFDISGNDDVIYFDYDKNSIEEINIDDLTKTNFELFNVKNVCYYKNKEYIANYEETDFNPDLQEIADEISCEIKHVDLDTENEIVFETSTNNPISLPYPGVDENTGVIRNYLIESDFESSSDFNRLLSSDRMQIQEVNSEEGASHTIDPLWKVKARCNIELGNSQDYTRGRNWVIWWLSKGEIDIEYTETFGINDNNSETHKDKYTFTYYDENNNIKSNTLGPGTLTDNPGLNLIWQHNNNPMSLIGPFGVKVDDATYSPLDDPTTIINYNQQFPLVPYPNQHLLDEKLGYDSDPDTPWYLKCPARFKWYWEIPDRDDYILYLLPITLRYVKTNGVDELIYQDVVEGNGNPNAIETPQYGMDFVDPTRSEDPDNNKSTVGNMYSKFKHWDSLNGVLTLSDNKKESYGRGIKTYINPLTGLNGIDTWKKQLVGLLKVKYPSTLIKCSYIRLAGITEPIYILGNNDNGIDSEGNIKGIKVANASSMINTLKNEIISRIKGIDCFGNYYAEDNNHNLRPITSFGVEYIEFNYTCAAGDINFGTDTEDLDDTDPAKVSTINFTVSANYKECSKAYTIKYDINNITINEHQYDYPTLMPFTEYEFYVHFVKQNGIATNGYKIGAADGTETYVVNVDDVGNSLYPNLRILYPIFSNIQIPDGYTSCFISYCKVKNDIAKCFNFRVGDDGYYYLDCLEADILRYNLNKNIKIFQAADTPYGDCHVDRQITDSAEYYYSGSSRYLPLFGNCGTIRFKPCGTFSTDGWRADCYYIKLENNATQNEYKKLIKYTPYLYNYNLLVEDSDQEDYDGEDNPIRPDENNVPEYVANLNGPAYICSIKKLNHDSDVYYVTGNDVYNKEANGSDITVEMNTSILANMYSKMFYLPSNFNLNYLTLTSDITPQIRKPSDDSNIDIIKQVIQYTQSLTSSAILEQPSMYRDYPRKYYVPYEDEHIVLFNNTIRSSDVNTDEVYRHIYTFEPDAYYNVPTNRGIIINLFQLSDFIYVHCQHALFKFTGSNTLQSDGGKVELKEGDVFDTGIKEVFDSQHGHAGLMYKHQSCVTFTAYFFYDGYSKQIYAYGGETQLANISDPIRKLLDDYKQDDILFVADENNDRVFINLKKDKDIEVHRIVGQLEAIYINSRDDVTDLYNRRFEDFVIKLRDFYYDARIPYDVIDSIIPYMLELLDIWIINNYTVEEFRQRYEEAWNNRPEVRDYNRLNFNRVFINGKNIRLVLGEPKEILVKGSDYSNICLSYHFKNKGYISIHDFDFIEGFGTRAHTYFANQKYTPLGYYSQEEFRAKYGWEINRIDEDVVRYTCYNGAFKPSDIGMPEVDNFSEPIDRNIRGEYETLEEQISEDKSQIVPSVIDVILNGDYEKIKNLEYVNWINSLVENYGFRVVNYAEEELNRTYAATKLRIYSDQCHTDLIQTVDEHNNPINANDKEINDFKGQMYPRYNCGIWSLNSFRDIKNANDSYKYNERTPGIIHPRQISYKYSQEDSLIYGKYFVLRLIYWNKKFKLENVEFKVNNYGKIS